MRPGAPWRAARASLLALAACGPVADEPDFTPTETATAYARNSPEGACLAAVATRVPDATLQVTTPGAETVGVTADGALWTCRLKGGVVTALLPPETRR